MTTKLERISLRAKEDIDCRFNNLGHAVNVDLLREQYQQLDGRKAVGIDGMTKGKYGENLEENLEKLVERIRKGSYKPKASKVVEIPKEDGSRRPLAISCFEDKLVQSAVNAILTSIYEPTFLPCSYGFRPNQGCHDALRALMNSTYQYPDGAIIEMDIQKYFNSIPLEILEDILEQKIADKRFLKLLKVLIRAPIIKEGKIGLNKAGCPQGSICSPILANVYLHEVIDKWFEGTVCTHLQGRATMVRYADDMVFFFEHKIDAQKFYRVLPKRLKRFGLKLHMGKTRLIASGRYAAARAHKQGTKLSTYMFLGFTCYWGRARSGFWRLKYTSRSDRFTAKLHGLDEYLRKQLNTKDTRKLFKRVIKVVRGWINYHCISDNEKRVKAFVLKCKRILFKWTNRRGRKRRISWLRFGKILNQVGFPSKWKVTSMFPRKPKQA